MAEEAATEPTTSVRHRKTANCSHPTILRAAARRLLCALRRQLFVDFVVLLRLLGLRLRALLRRQVLLPVQGGVLLRAALGKRTRREKDESGGRDD